MPKGSIAKENIAKKIAEVFGENFVGEFDKKLYVWADDGGEKVQVAISMTCPKTPIGEANKVNYNAEPGNSLDFENMSSGPVEFAKETREVSEEEKKNINDLMERLGL